MAYTILNTDGTTLLLLADGQIDKSTTSLTLIGKNYSSYGQELNNNFVRLLANSASSSGNPPRSPITGQLWYDTTVRRLKIYDNGFKTVGAVNIAASQPLSLQTGDLWWDSSAQQLKIYSAGSVYTVGPAFPSTIGQTGLVLPSTTVTDDDDIAKDVVLLKSFGTTVGVVYYDQSGNDGSFSMSSEDSTAYIPNATTSTIVSGLTVVGDLRVDGKLSNSYLSLSVDLDVISPSPDADALAFGAPYGTSAKVFQDPRIANILNQLYPPDKTVPSSTSTSMTGVPIGTQARVLCKYSSIGGASQTGYQVRVFRTEETESGSEWGPYYFRKDPGTFDDPDLFVNYITTNTSVTSSI